MNFEIAEAFLTSVTVTETYYPYTDPENVTADQLIDVLKHGPIVSTSSEDHPEFDRLRDQLAGEGYIEIQRMWWNGDRVLKKFSLNGVEFKPGEMFPCGAAMKQHLRFKV